MNTQENNKLIAEFMGMEKERHEDGRYLFTTDMEELKGIDTRFWEDLYFHVSWDWLMPVVNKIDEVSNDNTLFKIEYNRAFIEDTENYNVLIDVMANSRLEATYKAVVEFINQ